MAGGQRRRAAVPVPPLNQPRQISPRPASPTITVGDVPCALLNLRAPTPFPPAVSGCQIPQVRNQKARRISSRSTGTPALVKHSQVNAASFVAVVVRFARRRRATIGGLGKRGLTSRVAGRRASPGSRIEQARVSQRRPAGVSAAATASAIRTSTAALPLR